MVGADLAALGLTNMSVGLIGVVAGAWHAWRLRMAFASRTWPTVPGRIETAELYPAEDVRLPLLLNPDEAMSFIWYTYQVGPHRLRGRRVRFGWGGDSESAAEDYHYYHDCYYQQRDVTVYYNPRDPGQSVLEPGVVPSLWIGLVASLALFSFACWRLVTR